MDIIKNMKPEDIEALANEAGSVQAPTELKVLDLFTHAGLSSSNGDAKKLIQSGSLFVNETKIEDMQKTFSESDFVNGILLLRKGKKTFKVVKK